MKRLVKITIPDGVQFADLELRRDPDGDVSFSVPIIERVCAASGIDPAAIWDTHEDNLSGIIVAWYARHRELGGAPDPVAEDLILEAAAEDALGGGISHAPGRA